MAIKEYKVSKSAAKTAKENNLEILNGYSNEKFLFDFSLLDSLQVEEWEKEIIRDQAKNVTVGNRESYYGGKLDNFSDCMGRCLYYPHKVYSEKTGKRLFVIFQLAKIDHNSMHRKSIYDQFSDVTNYRLDCGYYEPLIDVEI